MYNPVYNYIVTKYHDLPQVLTLSLGHFQAFLGATYVDNFGRTVHCMRGRQPVTAEPVRERSPAKPSMQVSYFGGVGVEGCLYRMGWLHQHPRICRFFKYKERERAGDFWEDDWTQWYPFTHVLFVDNIYHGQCFATKPPVWPAPHGGEKSRKIKMPDKISGLDFMGKLDQIYRYLTCEVYWLYWALVIYGYQASPFIPGNEKRSNCQAS